MKELVTADGMRQIEKYAMEKLQLSDGTRSIVFCSGAGKRTEKTGQEKACKDFGAVRRWQ